jgi:DNA-binding PucR family transcriptional regulator
LQAAAGLPIAIRSDKLAVRYADVALVASIVGDRLFAESLRDMYLLPLMGERDGGETLRSTLRAYFAAERNLSCAAAVLGVSRRTVANRLRSVEAKIGRPLGVVMTEIDAALRLEYLDVTTSAAQGGNLAADVNP